ncbi:hypothetical protein PRIPAC_82555 [Pristionchus pacificus]|uniref:Uncharacterized protein n=1 Tax=Pristionchus pacificus TaxID=54126 RepID=A0A454XY56_PRIPA|nr:hypothetical protein PRIPAC_82555 [Pristionchus pacificus]|eukprot:PDM75511.1 hypothetical protein PRIPAC_42688 [Pristionchus pacificus]
MNVILLFIALPLIVLACDIKTTLKFNPTIKSGFARFKFFNETYGPVFEYREGENNLPQVFYMKGLFCSLKPTILETYEKDPRSGDIKPTKTSQAFLEGFGKIEYQIGDMHTPYVAAKVGVICGFGDCGNSRG